MKIITEVWKDLVGYEGLYKISNLGKVKRLTRKYSNQYKSKQISKEKILKGNKIQNGYLQVKLIKENKSKNLLIHRLVAITFIENPSNYEIVNHKDENKTNNCASNLEWCSVDYNNNYGTKPDRISKNHSIIGAEKAKKKVAQFNKKNELVNTFESITEASKKTNIKICNISECCKQKRKTAGGYIWKFI